MEGKETEKMIPEWHSPPWIVKKIFSDFIWESRTDKVLITIDDGPNAELTDRLLKFFTEQNLKTIMFFVGDEMMKNPNLVREVISAGHTIGCHSMGHNKLTKLSYPQVNEEISNFNLQCENEFGIHVKFFRPPYGRFNSNVTKAAKSNVLKTVMWSLLTFDYKNDFDIVKFAIVKYLKSNSIVVFHDNQKSKEIVIDSLKYLLDRAAKHGFRIGEPSECLK
ncbi:MAG: polysaccharide deacetylase family protein [bacterium]